MPIINSKIFMISSTIVMGILAGFGHCGVRINLTDSMPIGVYLPVQRSVVHRDDLVEVCLPKEIANQGLQNGYLSSGNCQETNAMPVLKQVIAMPGDAVAVNSDAIVVNGKEYAATLQPQDDLDPATKIQSKLGMRLTAKNYWLYGTASDQSWDSRYYGGVERKNIIGIYKPLFVF